LDDKGGYITNNSVVTGTGTGQTIIGGSAEIAVLPKQETTRSATVSDEVNIFKRGKKKKGYSRSISYQRD
jgi:hypothetical protein